MKYVLVNWSYNQPGRWISICSTDHEAAQELSAAICGFIKSYKRVNFNTLFPGGARATIEEIDIDEQAGNINNYLADIFTRNGWKGQLDQHEIYSFSRVS